MMVRELTTPQVADLLEVHRTVVAGWCKRGVVPARKRLERPRGVGGTMLWLIDAQAVPPHRPTAPEWRRILDAVDREQYQRGWTDRVAAAHVGLKWAGTWCDLKRGRFTPRWPLRLRIWRVFRDAWLIALESEPATSKLWASGAGR